MKSIARGSAVLGGVLLLGVLLARSSDGQSQNSGADVKSQLQAVLKQRRDTLKELVQVVQIQFQQRQASMQTVVQARNELIQADLDLAPDHAARVELLQQRLENMKRLEESAQKAHEIGGIGQAEVLTVRAERLKAEVELLREQSSAE